MVHILHECFIVLVINKAMRTYYLNTSYYKKGDNKDDSSLLLINIYIYIKSNDRGFSP